MKEIWKDIENYEGLYQISNLGNVKRLAGKGCKKERVLKPLKYNHGYLSVILHKDGKLKKYKVHRIVASAFIPNPDNLPEINHKDEDKTNNNVENLEWCDTQYNINYGTRTERMAKTLSKPVLCVETGVIYTSSMEVQRQFGYSACNICRCCNGKRNTHKGYHWQYVV